MSSQLPIKDKSEPTKLIKVTTYRKEVKNTEPHKHNNYFEIIYLSKGRGFHTIDQGRYVVKSPVIFFIRKEQVHHLELEPDTEPEGYVLILKKAFIEQSLDGELKKLLIMASSESCLYLRENTTISRLFELLTNENDIQSNYSFQLTEGLLKALLAKIMEIKKTAVFFFTAANNLYQSYQELLSQDHVLQNNVAHYAGLLHTTPQNLNSICRKVAGQSAAEVLSGYLINEAKRLLIYTENTVNEISFSLNFSDPSHFIKYFKRFTKDTPQSFRKK